MLEPTGASSEKPGQYLTGRRSSYWDTIQRASGHSAQEWVCFCPWPAMLRLFPVWFACAAFESAHESNHREGNDSLHGRRRHTAEWSMPGRTVAVLLVVGMIGEEQHDGAEWVWGRRGTATEKDSLQHAASLPEYKVKFFFREPLHRASNNSLLGSLWHYCDFEYHSESPGMTGQIERCHVLRAKISKLGTPVSSQANQTAMAELKESKKAFGISVNQSVTPSLSVCVWHLLHHHMPALLPTSEPHRFAALSPCVVWVRCALSTATTLSSTNRCASLVFQAYEHDSAVLGCKMKFSVLDGSGGSGAAMPVIYW
eukprot:1431442-Rhodomonas_salina.1